MSSSGVGSNRFARRNNALWRMNETPVNRPASQLRVLSSGSIFVRSIPVCPGCKRDVQCSHTLTCRIHALCHPQLLRHAIVISLARFICLDGGKTDGKHPQNGNGVACVST
ncbi:hypothetical protein QQF64_016938 [Cirrhinus molitorella]|uniref:Uncharacterized protein n=1 Tax=Cirrhinus molitorella TaxID=172907 RepID=A0ABR3LSH0_9TELE